MFVFHYLSEHEYWLILDKFTKLKLAKLPKTAIMKHLIFIFILIGLIGCQLDPCMNKEGFLKSYDSFIEKVTEANSEEKIDWAKNDAKFEQYIQACYKRHETDLTLKEKKDFWIKSMSYYHEKYGDDFYLKLNEENDPLALQMKTEIEKVFTASGQDVLDSVK